MTENNTPCVICKTPVNCSIQPHLYSDFHYHIGFDVGTSYVFKTCHLLCWQLRFHQKIESQSRPHTESEHSSENQPKFTSKCLVCMQAIDEKQSYVGLPMFETRTPSMEHLHFGCFFNTYNSTHTLCINQTPEHRARIIQEWEWGSSATVGHNRVLVNSNVESVPLNIPSTDILALFSGSKKYSAPDLDRERLAGRLKCASPKTDLVTALSARLSNDRQKQLVGNEKKYQSAYHYLDHCGMSAQCMVLLGLKLKHIADSEGNVDWSVIYDRKISISILLSMNDHICFTELLVRGMSLKTFMDSNPLPSDLRLLRFNYKAYVSAGGESQEILDLIKKEYSSIKK
jgi:hypothetical protein